MIFTHTHTNIEPLLEYWFFVRTAFSQELRRGLFVGTPMKRFWGVLKVVFRQPGTKQYRLTLDMTISSHQHTENKIGLMRIGRQKQ